MLISGYLGETEVMSKYIVSLFGFGGLYGIFYLIYKMFLENKNVFANNVLFGIYVFIWSLRCRLFLDEQYKNIFTNILDAIAKVVWVLIVGILYEDSYCKISCHTNQL